MKSLSQFISENMNDSKSSKLLFENLNTRRSNLTECFEAIGDAMLTVNEGFLGKIGAKLASWGKKAQEAGENADKKIDQLSSDVKDAVKTAIENTKKKAGKSWKKMGDAYKNVVADVAAGIDEAKDAIQGAAKLAGKKVSDMTSTVAKVVANGIAKGNEAIQNALKTPMKMAAIATLVGAAQACQKQGLDILDVLTAAGIE